MATKFVMGAGTGPPAGSYSGKFAKIEEFLDNLDKYGEGVLLGWEVTDGDHKGELATRICSAKLSPKSNLYKFAVALKGGPLERGEEFDFRDYLGTEGIIIVEEMESGSTRVATFIKK